MKRRLLILCLIWTSVLRVTAQDKYEWKTATEDGYTYDYVTNDPIKARFYTLDNGLTVILAENDKEPRISVNIPVRSGSNNDPANHTGLAHYLEHMLFKGTPKMGSYDWEKEAPLIEKITTLYERYNHTTDKAERAAIYKEIDAVSGEASKYSIAGEYDKLMGFVGSQGTNAWTWLEETVYKEEIPNNTVDAFLTIQAERFRSPVLRLFHTELEAVYEEKNQTYANDFDIIRESAMDAIFPTHNYGQQTTLGTIEHLRNPSLKAIQKFYNENYIPNNMGVVMVGDFDSNVLIKKIDKAFAYMQPKEKKEYNGPKEQPINGPIVREVFSPNPESISLFYRGGGANTKDALLAELAALVLSNETAGLMDINLMMEQQLQMASTRFNPYKDYGVFVVSGSPEEGQTLDEVKELLLAQIGLLKNGDFDASLIKAIVANKKLLREEYLISNNKISFLTDAFIKHEGKKWDMDLRKLDDMAAITKEELVAFANRFFTDTNYALIYKRQGEDKDIPEMVKPPITPVEMNADKTSEFVADIMKESFTPLQPVWVDYQTAITKEKLGAADMLYVQNKDNSLFTLTYKFPFGKYSDKKLEAASDYISFLGTKDMSAEAINQEFYKLACDFSVSVNQKETNVIISGLHENFEAAVALFEKVIAECEPDEQVLEGLKEMYLSYRADAKLDKDEIVSGLNTYALYGPKNPFNYVFSDAEIMGLKADELVDRLHTLGNYEHQITYYGPASITEVKQKLGPLHKLPKTWTPAKPQLVDFEQKQTTTTEILFADYDAPQADVYWLRNSGKYDVENEAITNLTNAYFGMGMGSIVFSTIREAKALAYSTYSIVSTPSEKDRNLVVVSYVGTQADKIHEAITTMNGLYVDLPESKMQFDIAKEGLKNDTETSRIARSEYMDNYLQNRKKGIEVNLRKLNYEKYDKIDFNAMKAYYQEQYKDKPFTYVIVGSKNNIDLNTLKQYGEVKEVNLEEIFGY
ncbi:MULTISPECIES: pitrilysin family protein [Flavobacteriaceae]|uniref:M16 family metallopeptidase n=1 Tax=Flavobacteriaceae TaxID=49546 RepID=UPI0014909C9A|nr:MULTISPECIES: M16 family metallopeptidase [Allomuricauda]MDC6367540.1 insulinase family protein [Muricauda sp. AC10]